MPRLARLDAPGVLHHIIIRGIERRKIFRDDKDKELLCYWAVRELGISCTDVAKRLVRRRVGCKPR